MAEAAGLVIGAIPLIALFQNCVALYDQIESLKSKNDDLDYLIVRATFEHCKFSVLQNRLESSGITTHFLLQDLVRTTLVQHRICLARLHKILCYHVHHVDLAGKEVSKSGNKVSRAVKWVATDRLQAERMVSRLKDLNDQLTELLPTDHRPSFVFTLLARSLDTTNPSRLRSIESSLGQVHPLFALAAGARALRIENYCNLQTSGMGPARCQMTNVEAFRWTSPAPQEGRRRRSLSVHDVVQEERASAYLQVSRSDAEQHTPVLVEWRRGFRHTSSFESHRYRLDQLVLALRQLSSQTDKNTEGRPDSPETGSPTSRSAVTKDRTSRLSFGVLECLGWITADRDFSHVGLVFRVPPENPSGMISLLEKIKADRRKRKNPPALGIRFKMAQGLVERVAHLIAIGWAHKSLRSHNILMFGESIAGKQLSPSSTASGPISPGEIQTEDRGSSASVPCRRRELQDMYISGFCYTRPGDVGNSPNLSTLPDQDPAFALYRPPRSTHVTSTSRNELIPIQEGKDAVPLLCPSQDVSLDIYGLGIILLEIALWRTIDSIYKEVVVHEDNEAKQSIVISSSSHSGSHGFVHADKSSPEIPRTTTVTLEEFQTSSHLRQIVHTLDSRVGVSYRDVVRKCLYLEGWWWPDSTSPSERKKDSQDLLGATPPPPELSHDQDGWVQIRQDDDDDRSNPPQLRMPAHHHHHQQQQQQQQQHPKDACEEKAGAGRTQVEFLESLLASLSLCRA